MIRQPGPNAASLESGTVSPPETPAATESSRSAEGLAASPLVLRLCGLLVATVCIAALAVAAMLHPNLSGTGTHLQLELPACSFLSTTGWPCPSCGLTTSMSAMAHGRIGLAWKAHPFGVALFAAVVVLAAAGTIQLLTGRNALARLGRPKWWVLGAVVALSAGWIVVLLTGLIQGTLPFR